jgi:hypothetical protein
MYDESNDVPVIIDFGLSFQIDKLTEANYRDAFYTLYAQYTCWSIEITLICYIIERIYKKKLETLKSPIKKPALEEMKKQVQIYISENEALKNHISDKEKDLFKLKINRYVNSFHEKTWKQLIDALISTYKSWDNYSMSVIIIREISHTGIIDEQKTAFLQDYLNIIKTVILSPPGQRQDTSITMAAIKNIFIKVNKIDYNTFKKGLRVNTIDQIRQRRAENTLSQLKQDNELKKRRVNP